MHTVIGSVRTIEYRMPAEWCRHVATWVSWPREETISFPGIERKAQELWAELVATIARFELVHVNVPDTRLYRRVCRLLSARGIQLGRQVQVHLVASNEPWIRDHGPIFVWPVKGRAAGPVLLNWRYNAWGEKYPPWDQDDLVPRRVAELLGCSVIDVPAVFEGGAVEVDGEGLVLASEPCLLSPRRNAAHTRESLSRLMHRYLGAEAVVWLEATLAGDDTDGHLDQLVRFTPAGHLLVAQPHPEDRENAGLFEHLVDQLLAAWQELNRPRPSVVPVRLPAPLYHDGVRLPASYLNYYLVQGAVVVPVFGCIEDEAAMATIAACFPGREVVPFAARELIWGLGAVHCATQQQPAGPSEL